MNAPLAERLKNSLRWLAGELAPFPGRGQFALRLTLASAIAIVIGETFQIPSMVMSLVAIFFTVQANVVLTRVIFIALTLADLIAVPLYIWLLNFTYDYPVLRIVVSSVLFFSFMFCVRVSKAGGVLLGPALVILYAQSFADLTGQAEYLVRQVLWAVLAITYGSVIALVVNSLFASANPLRQLQAEVHRQLARASERLRQLAAGEAVEPSLSGEALQQQCATLQGFATFANMANAKDYAGQQYLQCCVAAVSHAQHVCNALPQALPGASPALRRALGRLHEQLLALDEAIAAHEPFHLTWVPDEEERASLPALAQAEDLYRTVQAVDQFDSAAVPGQPPAKEPLLAPDAFTNPAYVRFALKILISGLIGYFVFNVLQWPGIHTILITSGMVALPGLGTSVRQMSLRFYGALLGSLSALLVFIFVMPYIDTIVGLLLTMVPVIAAGAWLTAGSERLAYLGTQGAATFALALLENFGPSTDLTEIRDRMVGIILGVGICWLVYAFIWPESEGSATRAKLAALTRSLAALVRAPVGKDDPALQMAYAKQHMQCWSALNDCNLELERVRYEPQFKHGALAQLAAQAERMLGVSRDLLVTQDHVHSRALAAADPAYPAHPAASSPALAAAARLHDETAALLELYAERVDKRGAPPLAEQEQLRALAQQTTGAAGMPMLADLQRLALQAAELPGWDAGNDAAPAAANDLAAPTPATRDAP
ncbi:FUSC family protein [Paraburkholderia silviterrae]|uniref:FUSC family protein n=1 Tax=Paraburkholderia silviterrae TaxID=2528715 RepID=A0A4V2ZXZ6_9BURK|nr:FUSC family protein [Paraburkholderia silviterrae]TDG17750.1 FUSC family protein [Paraburkholderia silviterrae]